MATTADDTVMQFLTALFGGPMIGNKLTNI
jgi:hypothetical protein